jgi:RNA polymerase sigma-70 factor (ECF subfamily)
LAAVPVKSSAESVWAVSYDTTTGKRRSSPITAQEVFEKHASRIFSLAWRLLSNYADAEDVTQDVLLSIVRKLSGFRGKADLKTWLHRVTVNAALAHRRRLARQQIRKVPEYLDQLRPRRPSRRPSELTPYEIAVRQERHRLIAEAISRLPEIYRKVFVLSDVEGLPNLEIGALLALSLAAVKSRLHRGRSLMRLALAPHLEEGFA